MCDEYIASMKIIGYTSDKLSILQVIYLRQDFIRDLADNFRRCPEPINILYLLTDFSCR